MEESEDQADAHGEETGSDTDDSEEVPFRICDQFPPPAVDCTHQSLLRKKEQRTDKAHRSTDVEPAPLQVPPL